MPVCSDCGDFFPEETLEDIQPDIERLYRSVADGDPNLEILQRIYDLFGTRCDLRPPLDEARVADRCKPGVLAHG
ncbi:hypothetical protein [Rhizobium oryzicola]|uniref:Uncharacterized protein n=1 Tax=Rhizobium oryzicola TaxID=1232668 RepID=A0ABT8SWZ4_9HYPH|nr:hypothetical protein [Rhizobium oryzicola]MDO1582398.1 hypothetical protein [Rhizobium oryzicola]